MSAGSGDVFTPSVFSFNKQKVSPKSVNKVLKERNEFLPLTAGNGELLFTDFPSSHPNSQ